MKARKLIRLAWFASPTGNRTPTANAGCRRNRHRPLLAPQGLQIPEALRLRVHVFGNVSHVRSPSSAIALGGMGPAMLTCGRTLRNSRGVGCCLRSCTLVRDAHRNRREVRAFEIGSCPRACRSCRSRSTTSLPKEAPALERARSGRGLAATSKVARESAAENAGPGGKA